MLFNAAIHRVSDAGDLTVLVQSDVLIIDLLAVIRKGIDDDLVHLAVSFILNPGGVLVHEFDRRLGTLLAGNGSELAVE
jgi:hypothetical protein